MGRVPAADQLSFEMWRTVSSLPVCGSVASLGRALERGVREPPARSGFGLRSTSRTGRCSTELSRAGLTPTVETDYERWKPLHWMLAVPDVMAGGGFDAVVGNPPFLGGQKALASIGTNIRDWFVNVLALVRRGMLISSHISCSARYHWLTSVELLA